MRFSAKLASKMARLMVMLPVVFTLFGGVSFSASGYKPNAEETGEIRIEVSGGELIQLHSRPATVFIADPTIADLQLPVPDRVFIYGKKPGKTTFFALGADGQKTDHFNIVVRYNTSDLRRYLGSELGALPVTIAETSRGVVLGGVVPNAAAAELVRTTAVRLLGDGTTLINNIRVSGSLQVSLRVRVAEVSRTIVKDLGINWSAVSTAGSVTFGVATGSLTGATASNIVGSVGVPTAKRTSINALLDALASRGLVSILAEPTLTAVSGEKASFLAGGEFPVPVTQSQTNAISVDYRKYGVSLEFTPTVLSDRLISLNVKPEVSDISATGAVTLNNFSIPALTTRRAETTVEMGSGESLVVGGLIQNRLDTTASSLPGVVDIPILGPLFRSTNFQQNQSELLIIVTPYIVRPVTDPRNIRLPNDGLEPATDVERILDGRLLRDQQNVAYPSK